MELEDVCGNEARPSFRAGQTPPAQSVGKHQLTRLEGEGECVHRAPLASPPTPHHHPTDPPTPTLPSPPPLPPLHRTGARAGRLQPDAGRRANARRGARVAAGADTGGRRAAESRSPRDRRARVRRTLDHCTTPSHMTACVSRCKSGHAIVRLWPSPYECRTRCRRRPTRR